MKIFPFKSTQFQQFEFRTAYGQDCLQSQHGAIISPEALLVFAISVTSRFSYRFQRFAVRCPSPFTTYAASEQESLFSLVFRSTKNFICVYEIDARAIAFSNDMQERCHQQKTPAIAQDRHGQGHPPWTATNKHLSGKHQKG